MGAPVAIPPFKSGRVRPDLSPSQPLSLDTVTVTTNQNLVDYLAGAGAGGMKVPAAGDRVECAPVVKYAAALSYANCQGTQANPIFFTCSNQANTWEIEGNAATYQSYPTDTGNNAGIDAAGCNHVWFDRFQIQYIRTWGVKVGKAFDGDEAPRATNIWFSNGRILNVGQEGFRGYDCNDIKHWNCEVTLTGQRDGSINRIGEGFYYGNGGTEQAVLDGTFATYNIDYYSGWMHDNDITWGGGEAFDVKQGVFNVNIHYNLIENWTTGSQGAITLWSGGNNTIAAGAPRKAPNVSIMWNELFNIATTTTFADGSGIHVGEVKGMTVAYNVIANTNGAAIDDSRIGTSSKITSGLTGPASNIYSNTGWNNNTDPDYLTSPTFQYDVGTLHSGNIGNGTGADIQASASDFVNIAGKNFHLSSGASNALRNGYPASSGNVDMEGFTFTAEAGALADDTGESQIYISLVTVTQILPNSVSVNANTRDDNGAQVGSVIVSRSLNVGGPFTNPSPATNPDVNHHVIMAGLTPSTTYYFQVIEQNDGSSASISATTSGTSPIVMGVG